MSKRYWIPGQRFCSVWLQRYFKSLLSYARAPYGSTRGSLQHTARIAAPLCSGGLAFSSAWHQEKTKLYLSRDDLNYFISSFVQSYSPLCAFALFTLLQKALLLLRHLCWNLDNDRSGTEKYQLRYWDIDYANSTVTTIQLYRTAAWMSMVPNTTKPWHYLSVTRETTRAAAHHYRLTQASQGLTKETSWWPIF